MVIYVSTQPCYAIINNELYKHIAITNEIELKKK